MAMSKPIRLQLLLLLVFIIVALSINPNGIYVHQIPERKELVAGGLHNVERKERLGFDAIYLIHIPAAPQRLELTDRLLKPHNLDIIYWEAETPETFLTKALHNWDSGPQMGAMACASSHISVYLDMMRRNLTNALILEDDIDLEMDLLNIWKEKSQFLPQMNWDFLYLGHCFDKPSYPRFLKIIMPSYPGWTRGVAVCTHAYAVTTSYIRKFLADMESPNEPIDVLLEQYMKNGGSNSFILDKPLFVQRPRSQENPSTIGANDSLPDQPLIQSAWATLNQTMNGDNSR